MYCQQQINHFSSNFKSKVLISLTVLSAVFLSSCKKGDAGNDATVLKINGSTTVNLPVAEAAEELRVNKGMTIQVDTQGGSSGGISMLGEGLVQLGMASKPITEKDRAKFPDCDFHQIHVGEDAVALIVSKDVWNGGIKAISQGEMQSIYERRITNWKELGGPDQRIAFFNKEPGRGTWEVFAKWAYGSAKKAPAVSFPEVGGNEETRSKVATTRGALSQLSSSWVDNESIFALALKDEKGVAIAPTNENIISSAYSMRRPLFLLSNGEPTGLVKEFVDFMLGERGQELVRKHSYLALDDLK